MREIFKELDDWIIESNKQEELPSIAACYFQVIGQNALLEANCSLTLFQTADIDAYTNAQYDVVKKLNDLLEPLGKHYDILSREIWMPKETSYLPLFDGVYVQVTYALPEYVLLSKALKAPHKNRALLIEYLASPPSALFMNLAKQYEVDLSQILEDAKHEPK